MILNRFQRSLPVESNFAALVIVSHDELNTQSCVHGGVEGTSYYYIRPHTDDVNMARGFSQKG
jgi:hypothetical protein